MRPPAMSAETAAAVLDVGPSATRQEVDRAFRLRARLCHPDRFAGAPAADLAAASAEFIRVCDAREVLHRRLATAPRTPTAPPSSPPWASAGSASTGRRQGSTAPPPRAPSSANRHQPPAPPPTPTMSFAEYVRARDAASWVYESPTGAPPSWAPPAPSAQARRPWGKPPRMHRTSTSFRVALLVLAVISVGGYLAMLLASGVTTRIGQIAAPLPVPAWTATDLLANASVLPVMDEATLTASCQTEFGCWVWSVTARADCPVTTITVGFSDTADGVATRTTTQQTAVAAEVPFIVVEHGQSYAAEFAGIEAMTC